MGMALRSVAQDGDLLALEQVQIAVFVVENANRRRIALLTWRWLAGTPRFLIAPSSSVLAMRSPTAL